MSTVPTHNVSALNDMEEIKKKLKARVGHLEDEGALNHVRELTALLEYVEALESEIEGLHEDAAGEDI
jgi:hypothetical protein